MYYAIGKQRRNNTGYLFQDHESVVPLEILHRHKHCVYLMMFQTHYTPPVLAGLILLLGPKLRQWDHPLSQGMADG